MDAKIIRQKTYRELDTHSAKISSHRFPAGFKGKLTFPWRGLGIIILNIKINPTIKDTTR